jgi:predicted DNA binding CopG/RHH family protein
MKKKNLKKSRIPEFKSNEEEANFWDTHSVTDFEDETEEVDIIFDLAKPRDETLVVRVQKNLKDKMERVAAKKGINVSTLARIWFSEKLQQAYK